MVKILSLLVLSVLLFVGGLAASLYLRPMFNPVPADGETEITPTSNSGAPVVGGGDQDSNMATPVQELPVPFHGRPMSTDDVFRVTASLRGREKQLKQREQELDKKEARLKMVEEDLRGQRSELDGLMEKIQDTYERTMMAFQKVQQERANLKADTSNANKTIQQANQIQQEFNANQRKFDAEFATLVEGMTDSSAAVLLTSLANNGDIELAAQYLSSMEPRNAAKIIEALSPDLQKQLTYAYRSRQPPPPTKRR